MQRCEQCGSSVTQPGLDRVGCLTCGATTRYAEPKDQGRVKNPDGAAHYYGDDGVTYG